MSDQPDTAGKKDKHGLKAPQHHDANSGPDAEFAVLFELEDRYPEPANLFADSSVASTEDENVIVALDTNALLLPYSVGKGDLNAIAEVYQRLAKEKRLFLPARAAREFIKHRDNKLAEMIKALDVTIHIAAPTMLDTFGGYKEMMDAAEKLTAALKVYNKAKSPIVAGIKNWRGNDPVTKLYRQVFTKDRIIEDDGERAKLADEWGRRAQSKTPPGYKDAGKPDTGIGDFLIWKAILKLGASRKRNMAFVTGETKSDWYVRSAGEAVYPRPELVDEYRRASEGHSIRLMPLADLLAELNAPKQVVQEVRQAEVKAETARQKFDLEHLFPSGEDLSVNEKLLDVLKSATGARTLADVFGARLAALDNAGWPKRRILVLPSAGSRADQHMRNFGIQPIRRIEPAVGMGSLGDSLARWEYPRFLHPHDAEAVLSHARQIDPYASWSEHLG